MKRALTDTTHLYTYGDYCRWEEEGERWELIYGIPYLMSPGPNRLHQKISGEIYLQLASYLQGKTCEVYYAPFDVRLPEADEADEEIATVVQPDLVVYCDRSKLDEKGGRGAPDMVVEILSPATQLRDQGVKLDLYERHGVREYWVMHPMDRLVYVFRLGEDGLYRKPKVYSAEEKAPVSIFEDLTVELPRVFAF